MRQTYLLLISSLIAYVNAAQVPQNSGLFEKACKLAAEGYRQNREGIRQGMTSAFTSGLQGLQQMSQRPQNAQQVNHAHGITLQQHAEMIAAHQHHVQMQHMLRHQAALQQQAHFMAYMEEFAEYDEYGRPIMGQMNIYYGNPPPY